MERLVKAWWNSLRAFGVLARGEAAFRQELMLFAASLPMAWFLSDSWRGYALLVGSLLVLMLVEVLNTGIEAACNAVSRDFRPEIQMAKDCGSLAVLIASVLAGGIWIIALAETILGRTL